MHSQSGPKSKVWYFDLVLRDGAPVRPLKGEEFFYQCIGSIWEDSNRMDLKEIGISTRNSVDYAQDRDYWTALVNELTGPISNGVSMGSMVTVPHSLQA